MLRYVLGLGPRVPPGDIIENCIGVLGKYHWWLMFLIFINKIPAGQQQISIVFLAPPIKFTCEDNNVTNHCPCDKPIFDLSVFKKTIVTEWTLICDKKTLVSFAQMVLQFGTLVGSLVFGTAADRFGRKWPLIVAVCLYLAAGVGVTFAPTYWLFCIFRFLCGACIGGTMVTGFVIMMEFTAMRHRGTVSALYHALFGVGTLSLPLISYNLRDFRDYHLTIVISGTYLLMYICVIPESPRWLLAVNKTDEAIKILTKVAKINRLPTANIEPHVRAYQASVDTKTLKKGSIVDLFRTPNIRRNTLAMAFQWFACSYCFYGVAQYISHLTADIFVNVTVSMTLVLFGNLSSVIVIRSMGRKTMLLLGQFLTSACFFALACIPPAHILAIIFASIGVVTAFMVFVLVYLYSSELFPTVVRSAALGFLSMIARVGSMIAPFIIQTKDIQIWLPPVIFAAVPAVSVVVAFILPETKDRMLSNTVAEGEAFGKKPKQEIKPKT